uniref:TRAF-type domain-containing protein n=1 Tax=Amphimedon queenslandica TaxID=400682 RepID=A0A1X7SG33_AMPQE
ETIPYCPRTDCGEEFTNEEGRPFFPDRFIRKEIDRVSIMCSNHKFGCDWNGKISEFLTEHLNSCAYEKEECPHCKECFFLFEYQSHVNRCPIIDYEQSSSYPIEPESHSFGYSPEEYSGPGQGGSVQDLTNISPALSIDSISSLTG